MDADELMMTALDAGAEDFSEEEDCYEIYRPIQTTSRR